VFSFSGCHTPGDSAAFLKGKHIERKIVIVLAPSDGYASPSIAWRPKNLFTAYVLLPSPGSIASGKVTLVLGLNVMYVSDEAAFRLFDSTGSNIGVLLFTLMIRLVVGRLLCSIRCL
jgi:hypothetical protein